MFKDFGRRRSRGQALAEFALVVPVLLLILLGGIDFGRLFFGWVNLNNAARIAADYAATNPTGPFIANSVYDKTTRYDAGGINCDPLTVTAPVFAGGVTDVGSTASVTLTCAFKMIFPIIGPVPLAASAVFPVRSGTIAGLPAGQPADCATQGLLTVPQLVGLRVPAARTAWTTAHFTGPFIPSNGHTNDTVTGSTPGYGLCRPATQTVSVTY